MTKKILAAIILFFGILALQSEGVNAANVSLKLSPPVVQISAFYNGATVEAQGLIPASAEALIRVSGAGEDVHVKKKGKAGGILWMNLGDVSFHNAPRVFMLYPSDNLTDAIESPQLNLGFDALKSQVEISPADEDKAFLFKEFVRLKKKEELYSINKNVVHYGTPESGMKTVKADLPVPPRMKQGSYRIELYAVNNGKIVGSTSETLEIKQVGFPAQLSSLAFDNALLHGILAVLIALGAGLLTGILFKGKGGAH